MRAVLDAIVSVDPGAPVIGSKGTEAFLGALESDDVCNKEFWIQFVSSLEGSNSPDVRRVLLTKLAAERILEVCEIAADAANRLAIVYAEWVKDSGFNFDACDGNCKPLRIIYRALWSSCCSRMLISSS